MRFNVSAETRSNNGSASALRGQSVPVFALAFDRLRKDRVSCVLAPKAQKQSSLALKECGSALSVVGTHGLV